MASKKIIITPEIYKKNIPANCEFQTLKQHQNMLLCWSLVAAIKENRAVNCGICELNTNNKKEACNG